MTESIPPPESISKSPSRTQRLHMAISVFVYGTGEDGLPFKDITKTDVINARGCLVTLKTPLVKGQKVLLVNLKSEVEVQCTVVTLQKQGGGEAKVGLSFEQPIPRFWGLYFPPEDWNPAERKRPGRHKHEE